MFHKILIANRGEIACRIIATAKKLGIKTVAVFSDADEHSRHVALADEAIHIGPAPASESYLLADKIIAAAQKTGAEAIHPGYGFLSENAGFAESCDKNGISFIGPPTAAIVAMGSKSEAKQLMETADVPLVPGYHGDAQDLDTLKKAAVDCGYPVLIKASAGGGGKGMRVVENETEFEEALASAKREALSSFGNDHVLVEKYLLQPRHIEIQVFADSHGNAVHLFERDCSVQRRHQKVVEEAPAPGMTEDVRNKMGATAIAAAKAINYVGAGTVEFIVDRHGEYFFMEMNTRLQVEHPVTEMISGQDLVEWQLHVAAGEALPATQDELQINGHSFEVRIYAEDPSKNFMPATGQLKHLQFPTENAHIRIDTGVRQGDAVSIHYDPMIAKLIVWDENRSAALRRMHLALRELQIVGLTNNVDFLDRIICHPSFASGNFDTSFIEQYNDELFNESDRDTTQMLSLATLFLQVQRKHAAIQSNPLDATSPWALTDNWRLNQTNFETMNFSCSDDLLSVGITHHNGGYSLQLPNDVTVGASASIDANGQLSAFIDGQKINASIIKNNQALHIFTDAATYQLTAIEDHGMSIDEDDEKGGLTAPMPGTIIDVLVADGDEVSEGQTLILLEAMKMEHAIKAPADGVIESVRFKTGDMVEEGVALIEMAS